MMAGVKMLHVPYKGAPEAITGVVAGQIDVGVPTVTSARTRRCSPSLDSA